MSLSQKRGRSNTPTIDLIEESVGLLRRAPADTLFIYLFGAIPFWLGLLYFLSDMSHNAYAPRHLPEASLAVALLYLWMKCWQTVFASRLRVALTDRPGEPWSVGRVLRLIGSQAAWQPWGFLVRTIAANMIIPYGWTVAFFQNLTVLGDGTSGHESSLASRSWSMARLWPLQAHKSLGVLWVFGFFVWLNVMAVLGFAPVALKMFLGIDTAFSRSIDAYFNTTFLTASFALTSLIIDPLWKAVFVLRCFRGQALRTGEDLAVELKQARAVLRSTAIAALWVTLCAFSFTSARAEDPAPTPTVEAAELDQRIGEVLERREYAWRAPREELPEEKDVSWFQGWMRGMGKALEESFKAVARKVNSALKWITDKLFKPPKVPGSAGSWDTAGLGKVLLVIFGVALLGGLVWALWRLARRPGNVVAKAIPVRAKPDLRAEHVVADQLPEDEWLQLANEQAARGEFQIALRAAWLASLANLGQRELLNIARHKSNRDYDRELRRRARTRDELLAAFAENLLMFERTWYGRHSVGSDEFTAFKGNFERIRAC